MESQNKQLLLTLSKLPFDVMITAEKTIEIRKNSDWINSRLFNKDGKRKEYDTIKFTNGYGYKVPYFIIEYKGFYYAENNHELDFSNGLKVQVEKGDIIIVLGNILESRKEKLN